MKGVRVYGPRAPQTHAPLSSGSLFGLMRRQIAPGFVADEILANNRRWKRKSGADLNSLVVIAQQPRINPAEGLEKLQGLMTDPFGRVDEKGLGHLHALLCSTTTANQPCASKDHLDGDP